MSFSQHRSAQREDSSSLLNWDFHLETEGIPLLHEGMFEPSTTQEGKSLLQMHIYTKNGEYMVRLENRDDQEQAFFRLGNLFDGLKRLEAALLDNEVEWNPIPNRNGSYRR